MTDQQSSDVAVTIIVPTFRSGDGLQHVFDSVDESTLPPGRLEVIFVDDGSGDDTVARLQAFAADRPHVQVIELENSGWPSRPRNVALDRARGEYVLFMDHDDSLFPDALRRAYEFGVEQDADVVSPKESKSNDAWWSLQGALTNVPDIRRDGGVQLMVPMVPHKLYRRKLLQDHNIRFPEERRFLWEDWYVNVPSYRHGKVSALVDTAVYRWHTSSTQTTHTFDPYQADYWDRLEQLLDHVRTTLSEEAFAPDRNMLIRHNLTVRVIQQASRQLTKRVLDDPGATSRLTGPESMILARSLRILQRYGEPDVMAGLPPIERARARVLRTRSVRLIRSLELAVRSLTASVRATDLVWRAGKLHLELETTWRTGDPQRLSIASPGKSARLDLGRILNTVLPRALREVGDPPVATSEVALRDRAGRVSWELATEPDGAPVVTGTGLRYRTRVVIDPATAAAGGPLPDAVFDLRVRSGWLGIRRFGGIDFTGPAAAMLTADRQGSCYRNSKGKLSLDLSGALRVPLIDAGPQEGPAGPVTDLRARLTRLALHEPVDVPVELAAIPARAALGLHALDKSARQERLAELATTRGLSARIVIEDDAAWFTGSADLPAGDYEIFAGRAGHWERTRYDLSVAADGMTKLATR